MATMPLWLTADAPRGGCITVRLAKCRNCGQTKVLSTPCGFDHLAALMEFNAYRAAEGGDGRG